MTTKNILKRIFGPLVCDLGFSHVVSEKAEDATFENPDFRIKSQCERCGTSLITYQDSEDPESYWTMEEYHDREVDTYPFRYREVE